MLNIIQIKRQIFAIKSTKKVLEAMRLISITSYPKINKFHESVVFYRKKLSKIFNNLIKNSPGLELKLNSRSEHDECNTLLIVIGSSKGLCGSFNSQLQRHLSDRLALDMHQNYKFLTVGKSANWIISGLKSKVQKLDVVKSIENLNNKNLNTTTIDILNVILSKQEKFSNVIVVGNSFKSIFSQKPKIRTILPIESANFLNDFNDDTSELKNEDAISDELIWEQNSDQIIKELHYQYLYASIYSLLSESILSETAARFTATDAAVINAKKQVDRLSLYYNKQRQSSITREVTELSSST